MWRDLLLWLCLLLMPLSAALAAGAPASKEPAAAKQAAGKQAVKKTKTRKTVVSEPTATEPAAKAKELSGMSIVGNDEAPKSLTIVPWKSSEMGMETSLNMMLTDSAVPVDRDVFMRQLDFYEISTKK